MKFALEYDERDRLPVVHWRSPRRSEEWLRRYSRSLGPMPEYARLETVELAIQASTLAMQMTSCVDDYEQYVRNVRQLRLIRDLLASRK